MTVRRPPRLLRLDPAERAAIIIVTDGIAPLASWPGWFCVRDGYTGTGAGYLVNLTAGTCDCWSFRRERARWGPGLAQCKHLVAILISQGRM